MFWILKEYVRIDTRSRRSWLGCLASSARSSGRNVLRGRSTRRRQLASGANCREKIHGRQRVWPWMHTHVHLLRVIHLCTPRLPRHPRSRIIDAYSSVTSNRYFGSKRLGRSAENLEHQILTLK